MKTSFVSPTLTLLGAGLLAALAGCQRHAFSGPTPPAKASALRPEPRVLRFGFGSAYTGFRTTYTLQTDGALLAHAGQGRPSLGAAPAGLSIPPAQVRAIFRRLDALPADSLEFEQPGNHYYFLESATASGQPVRLTWGAPDAPAPYCARVFYRQLQALVPPDRL
ncbi:hypothetical protein GCM10027048_41970 [Hymenobacter coalescens]